MRPDDVWVVTHPKCGTTWTQEMTWHIMTGTQSSSLSSSSLIVINIIIIIIMVLIIISIVLIVIISITGVDLATGQKPLFERSPFFDMAMIKEMSKADADKMFDDLDVHPSPRLIKTHYPFELLPANLLEICKVIWKN